MTADSQWSLQQAVHTALRGDAALTNLVADRIFDHVPQGTPFPYIVIGEATAESFDTKTEDGQEQTLTIHSWSRHRGLLEAKEIMAAVTDALDQQSLSIAGHDLVLLRFVFARTLRDPDGLTRHGVQRFRAITQRS